MKFERHVFGISVFQQGDRLGQYRLKNARKQFKPSEFNTMLMKSEGQFIKANFGKNFMQSLLTDDLNLEAGTYCVMIDPVWNDCVTAETAEEFKKVILDIYAPETVDIEVLEHEEGMMILSRSLKHAAMNLSPPEKKVKYLEDRPDYNKVIRVQDLDQLNCWYGFIYTNNLSSHTLEEEMKP